MTDAVACQEAMAFLQKCSSAQGTSVYDHLTSVLAKVSDGP